MNNFTHQVYLLTDDNAHYQQILSDSLELTFAETPEQATILLASPLLAAKRLHEFPNVEWIQSTYAGVDSLVPKLSDFSGDLTNVKGIFGQQISEYVLGYTIAHQRHFYHYQQEQQNLRWNPMPYQTLAGKTMLILGTGSIASHLATSAKALGLKTMGVNQSGIPTLHSSFDDTYHIQELHSALPKADIIVNTLPNTPDTYQLLCEETLSLCHNALLFNVGRGDTVEEQGVINALESGSIEHAFLDVFEHEPLPTNHPFWQHPKVTITPHIAAVSFPEQVVEIFAENYQRRIDGYSLINRIDIEKGY